jgi:hypothetical protein
MRHTRPCFLCLAFLLLLAAGTARAEEIIYFTNGTAMPIRAYEVRDSMIHVDLGGDSFMAFPLTMVEKVEAAGKEVVLDPSFSGNMRSSTAAPGAGGNFPVRGSVPSRYSDSKNKLPLQVAEEDPEVDYDGKMGVAVYRPFQGSRQAGKRMVGAAGNQRVTGRSDRLGAQRVGSRHVIGATDPPNANNGRPPLVGLEPKSTTKPPTQPPADDQQQDSGDSGSGD